jgi:hypothetical protein
LIELAADGWYPRVRARTGPIGYSGHPVMSAGSVRARLAAARRAIPTARLAPGFQELLPSLDGVA